MPAGTVNIVGYAECMYSQRALQAADMLVHAGVLDVNRQIFTEREQYLSWLKDSRASPAFMSLGAEAQNHSTSPIVYSEDDYVGGCHEFEALAARLLDVNVELSGRTSTREAPGVDHDASLNRFEVTAAPSF